MSEMSIFSIAVLIGTAGQGIARLIGKACGDISQYQPKNDYLATPEREMLLQSLYSKSFASLEDQYLVNNDMKQFHENLTDDFERSAQLKAIHVISMFESVSQIEPMAFVVEKKHGDKLKKIGSAISAMKKHLITPTFDTRKLEKLAEDSEPIIRKITNDSHSLLARAEQELALKTVAESMSSLAYNVKTSGMALVASKGSASVRAGFDGGRVRLDTISFPGGWLVIPDEAALRIEINGGYVTYAEHGWIDGAKQQMEAVNPNYQSGGGGFPFQIQRLYL